MRLKEVEIYLEILRSQLLSFDIPESDISKVLVSVSVRMYSLIGNWNDKEFRNSILITGLEEGIFYEPEANQEVKSFVVVTIRNSEYESLAYATRGKQPKLSTEQTKYITSEAIKYFSELDFDALSKRIGIAEIDFYDDIVAKYPVTWIALQALGSNNDFRIVYEPIETKKFRLTADDFSNDKSTSFQGGDLQSGIDSAISPQLAKILKSLDNNQVDLFYADSFKYVSRNIEKLLKVMEYVLTRKKYFCTPNYLISNGYIEKRQTLLRPAYSQSDAERKSNMRNIVGLQELHKEMLSYLQY